MGDLRILAFDTSGPHCAASLVINGEVVASATEDMRKGQAERLMPMLDEVMASAGAVWEELDGIGVGVGPGNFTGIRIAVAAARGLSLALGIPAVGVNLFEALRGPEWFGNTEPQFVVARSSRRGNDVVVQRFAGGVPTEEIAEGALSAETGPVRPDIPEPDRIHSVLGTLTEVQNFNEYIQGGAGQCIYVNAVGGPGFSLADKIALVAALKLSDGAPVPRPAPLYVRPADAAPASDPPPVILE